MSVERVQGDGDLTGKHVKIRRGGERFWLKVVGQRGKQLRGTVANNLLVAPFKHGDELQFQRGEILDVMESVDGD